MLKIFVDSYFPAMVSVQNRVGALPDFSISSPKICVLRENEIEDCVELPYPILLATDRLSSEGKLV